MSQILHIADRHEWEKALSAGLYRGDTLDTEGFIHCSTRDQVVRVANARFKGRQGLLLLCIDPSLLQAELRYEPAEAGELFPHIYGPLNLDAVVAVHDFEPAPDGGFTLPHPLS